MSAGYVAPTLQQLLSLEAGSARRAHRTYQQLKRTAWIGPTHAYCAEQAKNMRDHALRRARTIRLELLLRDTRAIRERAHA